MDDCKSKGRFRWKSGEEQWNAKLSEKQVVQIRQMYQPGIVTYAMIGRLFGVSGDDISRIIRRKSWKHIP